MSSAAVLKARSSNAIVNLYSEHEGRQHDLGVNIVNSLDLLFDSIGLQHIVK